MMRSLHRPRQRALDGARTDGMTLIEVVIVVVIMAVAAGGATMALNGLTRAELRAATGKLVAASRFAYHRAVVRGRTVRITLDLESGGMGFEEADGRVYLARNDDDTRLEQDETDGDEAGVDPWSAAEARLGDTLRVSFGRSPFGPISDDDGDPLRRYQTAPLGDNVRILRVITPHEVDPREEGTAHIYFFPGGRTERAVVQLTDGEDRIFTVVIHPLTGRGRVYNYAYEPEDIEDTESELRDPG